MDHDLPLFRFAHAVHSDVISTQVFYNNCRLTNVNLVQFEKINLLGGSQMSFQMEKHKIFQK